MAKKAHHRVPGGFPAGGRPGGGMPSLESLARRAAEMQEQLEAQRAALAFNPYAALRASNLGLYSAHLYEGEVSLGFSASDM